MKKSSLLFSTAPVSRTTTYYTYPTDSHMHDQNELLFLVQGNATYTCNTNAVDVVGPVVVLFNSYSIHGGVPPADGIYDRYVVYFQDALLESEHPLCVSDRFFKGEAFTVIPLTEAQKEVLLPLFSRLEAYADDPEATAHLTLWLLYELSRWFPEQSLDVKFSRKAYIDRVLQYLAENYAHNITLETLCGHFYISRAKLVADFKAAIGISINNYLSLIRLCNAKAMLDGGKSIAQTTSLCGFSDESYFIRKFAQYFGLTPGQYLRERKPPCST